MFQNSLEFSSKEERSTGGNVVPASYKSSRKNKDFVVDSKDQQVLFIFFVSDC